MNGADVLRRLRLQLVKGTPGWRIVCRATDYIDWVEGRTTYYKAETPWYRRWWCAL